MDARKSLTELSEVAAAFLAARGPALAAALDALAGSLKAVGKVLLFGNGGSAAEAQHFAAELVNKFLRVRPAIAALALTTDTSCLTSIGNDVSYDVVFSRQVEALGRPGDVAIGLSTSGDSPNVIEGLQAARRKGLRTIALTGEGGGQVKPHAEVLLDVPSASTPRVQEAHLVLLHLLAEEIEERLG
jgi:D-sedoheptulose 7-phosphate isomerase